jgi:hypothetical protein
MPKFSMNQIFKCVTGKGTKIAGVHPALAGTNLGPLYAGVKVIKFKSAEF